SALVAPASTRRPVAEELTAALKLVLSDPRSVRQIAEHGVTVDVGGADQLGALVACELAKWTDVVDRAGLAARDRYRAQRTNGSPATAPVGAAPEPMPPR